MIERMEIDGRSALVIFLKKDFTPCNEDEAEMVKIVFDDGEISFAMPGKTDAE